MAGTHWVGKQLQHKYLKLNKSPLSCPILQDSPALLQNSFQNLLMSNSRLRDLLKVTLGTVKMAENMMFAGCNPVITIGLTRIIYDS